ncbi:MAG: DUF1801 domain-containing protein [Actinomycetota bacterium]
MATNPEVSAWFKDLDHPLKKPMLEVRKIIMATDRRVTETIKWKSPTFVFEGNMASIDPKSKKYVQLMFHQGASLQGKHPKLEGGGGTVRYLRFTDADDVKAKKRDLEAAVRAWVKLKSG